MSRPSMTPALSESDQAKRIESYRIGFADLSDVLSDACACLKDYLDASNRYLARLDNLLATRVAPPAARDNRVPSHKYTYVDDEYNCDDGDDDGLISLAEARDRAEEQWRNAELDKAATVKAAYMGIEDRHTASRATKKAAICKSLFVAAKRACEEAEGISEQADDDDNDTSIAGTAVSRTADHALEAYREFAAEASTLESSYRLTHPEAACMQHDRERNITELRTTLSAAKHCIARFEETTFATAGPGKDCVDLITATLNSADNITKYIINGYSHEPYTHIG